MERHLEVYNFCVVVQCGEVTGMVYAADKSEATRLINEVLVPANIWLRWEDAVYAETPRIVSFHFSN